MGKPRRPRGGRPAWEPKPPHADATAPAEAGADPVQTETPPTAAAAVETAAAPEAERAQPAEQAAPEGADARSDLGSDPRPEPSAIENPAPAPVAEPEIATASADDAAPEIPPAAAAPPTAGTAAGQQSIVFAPERWDVVEIGSTIARYMRGEGEAALAHLRALSDVRTPADLIRLQVGEAQRAADASLTCWVTVMGKASRVVAFR